MWPFVAATPRRHCVTAVTAHPRERLTRYEAFLLHQPKQQAHRASTLPNRWVIPKTCNAIGLK